MRLCFVLPVNILFLVLMDSRVQAQKQDLDRVSTIATSGQVEIEAIRIVRQIVSGAVKNADLTNMDIELWLTRKGDGAGTPEYNVRLLNLSPVEDNTGKLLSTKNRMDAIPYLRGYIGANRTKSFRGREGPGIVIKLEAPASNAMAIKSLKGKAAFSSMAYAQVQFDNLAELNGKILDDPNLKDIPIRFSIKVEEGMTLLSFAALRQHHDRLSEWALVQNGELLGPISETIYRKEDSVVVERSYRGEHEKNASLVFRVAAEPSEVMTLDFEFKDLKLP